MSDLDIIGIRLFALLIVLTIGGIYIESAWPSWRERITRRRMARYMNHRTQWGHVWHRRRM